MKQTARKIQYCQTPSDVISICLRRMRLLRKEIEVTEQLIKAYTKADAALLLDHDLLTSLPAVGSQLGMNLLIVLRSHDFGSASQAAAFLGVAPVKQRSGTSVRGISKMSKLNRRRGGRICICPPSVPDNAISACASFMKNYVCEVNLKWWQSELLCES